MRNIDITQEEQGKGYGKAGDKTRTNSKTML